MNTQYRKNLKDVATACKNYTDKRFEDFKWELGTHTIDTTTDSDVAYQKQAPNGTIGCQIYSVGGMSYKSKNMFYGYNTGSLSRATDFNYSSEQVISFISTGGDSYIGNVISSGNTWSTFLGTTYEVKENTTYAYAFFDSNMDKNYYTRLDSNGVSTGFTQLNNTNGTFTTTTGTKYITFRFGVGEGVEGTTYHCKFMLVEGSTAPTEFKQGFEGIRDSAVTSVVANSTLNIPASIQALEGYGWGINDTCYNYIDFENKKFIQKVGRVALNDLNVNSWVKTGSNNIVNNGLTPLGKASSLNVINTSTATMAIGGNTNQLVLLSTSYLNGTLIADWGLSDFKTYITNNTIYVYYELATPVETDISSYITDNDKFLEVEPLGTITFTNTYEQEVPSEITYLTEVAK